MGPASAWASSAPALDVDQVDFEEARVTVRAKGNKVHTVPIGFRAADAIRRYLGERFEGPLFLSAWKMRITARTVQRTIDKYAAKANIGPISPHTLRHSMASHMLRRGAYAFKVRQILGHQSLRTTAGYLHGIRDDDSLDDEHRRFHPRG